MALTPEEQAELSSLLESKSTRAPVEPVGLTPDESTELEGLLASQAERNPSSEFAAMEPVAQQATEAPNVPAREDSEGFFAGAKRSVGDAIGPALDSVGEFFTGSDRQTRATEELEEVDLGLMGGEGAGANAKFAAALAITTDPQELGQIAQSISPNIRITQDEKMNFVAHNIKTGVKQVLNMPGFSGLDAAQGVVAGAAFTPAGVAARAVGKGLAKKGLSAVSANAATEGVIQGGQAALGGEFDGVDVALTGALGGVGEGIGQAVRLAKANKAGVIPKETQAVLDKGDVLTSDLPDRAPKTFVSKIARNLGERIPFIGTGGLRAKQQESRIKAVEDIMVEFGADKQTSFGAEIVASASEKFAASQKRAGDFRAEVLDKMAGSPTNTKATRDVISESIERIKDKGTLGDPALIRQLEDIDVELAQNPDFAKMVDIRTEIFNLQNDIGGNQSALKSGADTVLSKISGAMSKQLDELASVDPEVGRLWRKSNRIFRDNIQNAKSTKLKALLTKGDLTPEQADIAIKNGKPSDLRRLRANLTPDGKAAVQKQILRQALEASSEGGENINPAAFRKVLAKTLGPQARIFFRGKDKAQLDGLTKFLEITDRAQKASLDVASKAEISLGTAAGVGGGAIAGGLGAEVMTAAVAIGLYARFKESKKMRDMLLRLANAPAASAAEKNTMDVLKTFLVVSEREG